MFITIMLVVASALLAPWSAELVYADSHVMNTIYVEAHADANTSNGVVRTGTSSATVDITTIVNGEKIVDIHKTSNGEPIVIEHTTINNADQSLVTTNLSAQTSRTSALETETEDVEDSASTDSKEHTTQQATTLGAITNVTNEIEASDDAYGTEPFFTRIMHAFTRSITYVLSTLFT